MRIKKITQLINMHINNHNNEIPLFDIKNNLKKTMINNVVQFLMQWKGGKYKKPITTINEAWKKVCSYWNTQKAVQLGDHLFYPIFCYLFKVL